MPDAPRRAAMPEAQRENGLSLEQFLGEAEAFLSTGWPRKEVPAGPTPFVWGEGSDEMKVFQEPEPAEEAEMMTAVRGWRRALFDAGFGWISGPAEYGGRGLPGKYERAFESLARRYDVPGDSMLTVSLGMIAPTIHRFGTTEQHARWLPALRSGDLIACQLFSEPNAGSDLASIGTKADPDGQGGWRISGQKVWTSGAHLADIGEIICRTSDGPRHQNLTAFIVDMRAPGVEVRPLRQMTGGAAFNEVFFTDVAVTDAERLGEIGEGWKVALTTLGFERSAMGHSAFGGVGLLRTDRLAAMLHHTGSAGDPVARQDFAKVVVALRAARCLQSRTGALAKAGQAGPELSMNKLALSDNFRRLSDFAVRTLGPSVTADTGDWGTYAWTSVLLGAPGYRLGGGTDQILKNILAERVLGLPKPAGFGGKTQ